MKHDYYSEDIDSEEYERYLEYLHQIKYEGLLTALEDTYRYIEKKDENIQDNLEKWEY